VLAIVRRLRLYGDVERFAVLEIPRHAKAGNDREAVGGPRSRRIVRPEEALDRLFVRGERVGLELEILALNPGFGNVARRQTSALRWRADEESRAHAAAPGCGDRKAVAPVACGRSSPRICCSNTN
jgi:hypothetical protein